MLRCEAMSGRKPAVVVATTMVAALLGMALGCAERLADLEDDGETLYPTCMAIGGTLGFRADGTQKVILDPDGSAAAVCVCMTPEEYQEGSRKEELNDLLYEECLRLVEFHGYVSSECLQDYESGHWLGNYAIAVGNWEDLNNRGLSCEVEELGCKLGGESGGSVATLLVLLAVVRRRSWKGTSDS